MIDNIDYYMEYLDGLTKDMPEEFVKLAQVFELNVFEPIHMEGEDDIYAAYLMNDSVESYFVFENSVMTGEYKDIDCDQIAGIEKLADGYMLIVNQGGENIFTIRFTNLRIRTDYFNYGCMGHFWVKGYEYLRQLEYQLADIRDKYRYLGDEYCSEKEMQLMKLADFPPIKRYKSVPDRYYVPYPDCVYQETIDYLLSIAQQVNDCSMAMIIRKYGKKPSGYNSFLLGVMLHTKKHADFVDALIKDLRDAASIYDDRIFSEDENREHKSIHIIAEKKLEEYEKRGFRGILYREEPFMYSKDSITYKEHVLIYRNGLVNRHAMILTFE